MDKTEIPAQLENDDQSPKEAWEPVLLMIPRYALVMSRSGVQRRLLWPGAYEKRQSRTLNSTVFRNRR